MIRTNETNYLRKIPEIASIHPSLQKEYEKRLPWSARKLLESNMLTDKNKIRLIRMADQESGDFLEKGIRNIDKGSYFIKKFNDTIRPTHKSREAYELYKISNYGGKKTKRKKTKHLSKIKPKKKNTRKYRKRYFD